MKGDPADFQCQTIKNQPLQALVVVFAAVFFACLFGVWTRPVGFLATFWPANAVMLGLLLRRPALAGPVGWISGAMAFIAADLLTGSTLTKALVLNGANIVGVGAAYFVLRQLPAGESPLTQPVAMLHLLLASATGGAAAGIVGGIANPILFSGGVVDGWIFWFATEFVNYVAILPVILSAPKWQNLRLPVLFNASLRWRNFLPAFSLLLSFAAADLIGGPGALAFPVPALLWCGLAYPVFVVAVLTLLFSGWALVVISAGYGAAQSGGEMALVSLRLGISLIAVAPIMLACAMQGRNTLLTRLRHLAMHDSLTGIYNRQAFREQANERLASRRLPCALLLLDLDHFKKVNDTYGHAAGDQVLLAFAARLGSCLRADDLVGRIGGEEFAAMLSDCSQSQAIRLAERILQLSSEPIALHDGRLVPTTTSIGIAVTDRNVDSVSLDALFHSADLLLYRAKHAGRNRLEIGGIGEADSPGPIAHRPGSAIDAGSRAGA